MLQKICILFLIFVSLQTPFYTDAHPQCLDFKAPFNSSTETSFGMCLNYQEFGCCHNSTISELQEKFEVIKYLHLNDSNPVCSMFLGQLMCQICSPYAAHLYDAENQATETRTFPSLCTSYCTTLWDVCKPILSLIVEDQTLVTLLQRNSSDAFCRAVAAPDVDYCYPKLLSNEVLYDKTGKVSFYKNTEKCKKFCVKEMATDLYNPITLKHAKDGSHRMFVGEQRGVVWIYLANFTRLKVPFLDIQPTVLANENRYDERGFLDIEFHPDFLNNGRFFTCYTKLNKKGGSTVTINEMRVSKDDMNVANISSERTLLTMDHPLMNHNGGQLLFDDDGFLHISTGDGGGQGDPFGYGQNKKKLLGKMLRIDVDKKENGKEYAIPKDNPFSNDKNYLPEIYALGIRNVWRCSKDRGDNNGSNKGRIFCGDVGQSKFEEIIELKKGANFGWKAYEGNSCYKEDLCKKTIKNYSPPIHAYPHSVGKSVTGGYFYRGCHNPHFKGLYIFGDYHNGEIFSLQQNAKKKWIRKSFCLSGPNICKNDGLSSTYSRKILAFGEDEAGELYFLSTIRAVPGLSGGSIYKIVDPTKRGNPNKCKIKITRETIIKESKPLSSHHKEQVNPVSDNSIKQPIQSVPSKAVMEVGLASFAKEQPGEKHRGVVMVMEGNKMGLICADRSWGINDAHVICRMLGFEEATSADKQTLLPIRDVGEFLGNIQCTGTETTLSQCKREWLDNCTFFKDAAVICDLNKRMQNN